LKSCPAEVRSWVSKKRRGTPEIKKLDVFQMAWLAWYNALLPEWNRDANFKAMRRSSPALLKNETWSSFSVRGNSGVYLLIVSLSWWLTESQHQYATQRASCVLAINELNWVLQQLTGSL